MEGGSPRSRCTPSWPRTLRKSPGSFRGKPSYNRRSCPEPRLGRGRPLHSNLWGRVRVEVGKMIDGATGAEEGVVKRCGKTKTKSELAPSTGPFQASLPSCPAPATTRPYPRTRTWPCLCHLSPTLTRLQCEQREATSRGW